MNKPGEFIDIIGSEFPADRLTYQKAVPTFHVETAEDAAALFKLANKYNQKVYITGFGNNIDPAGEPFLSMLSIRTDRLNKVIEIAPDDFYIKVGSGYPLREINQALLKHQLYLPHGSLHYVGSVGGALAAGLSTKLHNHEFPLKKYFIQAEIVTPEGEIITPGSTCFKSVSGYDVVKIFAGSWGLLGLIVSATFRVMPLSGAEDFSEMKMKDFNREQLVKMLDENNYETDAEYCRKIKQKFDPNNILPVV